MRQADKYAVIGHPISHSRSPAIHKAFAQITGQDITYDSIDGGESSESFEKIVREFFENGGRGLNITLPFKTQAMLIADVIADDAKAAGAANALKFEDGKIFAQNFDGSGLVRDIGTHAGALLFGAKVLILGAGGATRGAILPIARAGARQITVANRTFARAKKLVDDILPHMENSKKGSTCQLCAAQIDLPEITAEFDIIINATSASLTGQYLPISNEILARAKLCYDMAYSAKPTSFLEQAQKANCPLMLDGMGMLVEQAADAFVWWRGVRPATEQVRKQMSNR